MRLVVYIRGGLGDVWPAVSAVKEIQYKYGFTKFETFIITDSVYYFRNYPREVEKFSLDMLQKISANIIEVPPYINNNFKLDVDDVTDELSQESAYAMKKEFMFWRPNELKEFVSSFFIKNTMFVDSLFTECIMQWNFEEQKYYRVENKRAKFIFNPAKIEKEFIDKALQDNHLLIHIRKKQEGDSYTFSDEYYNKIIKHCDDNNICAILIGTDSSELDIGYSVDLRGNTLSFEGMAYLISECKAMLGNDSGFSAIKLYQQQEDNLLIMEHPRWSRSAWYFRALKYRNCNLFNAKENNYDKIINLIGEHYDDN